MKALLITILVALPLTGCAGNAGNEEAGTTAQAERTATETASPDETAAAFMRRLSEQQIRQQWGRIWEQLHPAHKAILSREHFMTCAGKQETVGAKVDVDVVDTYEEPVLVKGEGTVPSTAVTVRYSYDNPLTGKKVEQHDTSHAVLVDGEWTWILSPAGYDAYRKGPDSCPEE